jgi:hypothetical protein
MIFFQLLMCKSPFPLAQSLHLLSLGGRGHFSVRRISERVYTSQNYCNTKSGKDTVLNSNLFSNNLLVATGFLQAIYHAFSYCI